MNLKLKGEITFCRSVFRRTCCTWPLLRLASALILVAALVMLLLRSMRQQVWNIKLANVLIGSFGTYLLDWYILNSK